MLTLRSSDLPAPEADIRAALATYRAALAAHARTVGRSAPWPEYEILREIVRAGDFVVAPDEQPEPEIAAVKLAAMIAADSEALAILAAALGLPVPKERAQ